MKNASINTLLQNVSEINRIHFTKAVMCGEKYNPFFFLMEDRFNKKRHNDFIADLLKPNGSHGQGRIYLKLFLNCFSIYRFWHSDDREAFSDYTEVEVLQRQNVEVLTEEKLSKTINIDIVVKTKNKTIRVINNLFEAENESIWEDVFDRRSRPVIFIKTDDVTGLEYRFNPSTPYKTIFFNWLNDCIKASYNLPHIRETISQYLKFVQVLTKNSINVEMDKEIIKSICLVPENINAAVYVANNIIDLKRTIMDGVVMALADKNKALNDASLYIRDEFGEEASFFQYSKEEWKRYHIVFHFNKNYEELMIGLSDWNPRSDFVRQNENSEIFASKLNDLKFGKPVKLKSDSSFSWAMDFEYFKNANWSDVHKGELIEKMFEAIDEICKKLEGMEM